MLTPPSSTASDLTYAVEVIPTPEISPGSFRLESACCHNAYEFFSNAYEHFRYQLIPLIRTKNCYRVDLTFTGTFVEDRVIEVNDEMCEVPHIISHNSVPTWIYTEADIAHLYDCFKQDVFKKIDDTFILFRWQSSTFLTVRVSDFEDFLD